jgi:hypothetical protein
MTGYQKRQAKIVRQSKHLTPMMPTIREKISTAREKSRVD